RPARPHGRRRPPPGRPVLVGAVGPGPRRPVPAGRRGYRRPLMAPTRLLFVAEQLRGRVPGGIGTYARGVLQGLAPLPVEVTLWASRGDPPGGLDLTLATSALPGKALVWGWD